MKHDGDLMTHIATVNGLGLESSRAPGEGSLFMIRVLGAPSKNHLFTDQEYTMNKVMLMNMLFCIEMEFFSSLNTTQLRRVTRVCGSSGNTGHAQDVWVGMNVWGARPYTAVALLHSLQQGSEF